MSKKKGKKPDASGMNPIDKSMLTGEIPWTMEGLGEVLQHAVTLHHTPHDDWNRRKKGINLMEDDATVRALVFNPDTMENQMMNFIISRLRKRGVSQDVLMSHGWRYMQATGFMVENVARLRQEGLILDDPDDRDASLLSGGLITTLATARYEGVRLHRPSGEPERTFHLERVIAEAKRLDAEED